MSRRELLQRGRFRVVFEHRPHNSVWGRFGGGWQWELGFQLGGSTLMLNLLVFSIRIDFKYKRPAP